MDRVAVSARRVNGIHVLQVCGAECTGARVVAPRTGPTEEGYCMTHACSSIPILGPCVLLAGTKT